MELARTTLWLGPKLNTCGVWEDSSSKLVRARDHPQGNAAGVDQINRHPAQGLRQRAHGGPGRIGQPQQVGVFGGDKSRADEPRTRATADQHARRAGVAATQVQLVVGAQRDAEPERQRKRLRFLEVRLLELQPDDVVDLDHRVGRAPRVLTRQSALLAVQAIVGADQLSHCWPPET